MLAVTSPRQGAAAGDAPGEAMPICGALVTGATVIDEGQTCPHPDKSLSDARATEPTQAGDATIGAGAQRPSAVLGWIILSPIIGLLWIGGLWLLWR